MKQPHYWLNEELVKMIYNLSILCIDGETIYGLISSNKKLLLNYLRKYDHEGSNVSLVKHEGGFFMDVDNSDKVYSELEESASSAPESPSPSRETAIAWLRTQDLYRQEVGRPYPEFKKLSEDEVADLLIKFAPSTPESPSLPAGVEELVKLLERAKLKILCSGFEQQTHEELMANPYHVQLCLACGIESAIANYRSQTKADRP